MLYFAQFNIFNEYLNFKNVMEVGIRRLEYVNHVSRSSVINDISRYRKGEKYALIKSQIILFAFPFKLHLDLQYV